VSRHVQHVQKTAKFLSSHPKARSGYMSAQVAQHQDPTHILHAVDYTLLIKPHSNQD